MNVRFFFISGCPVTFTCTKSLSDIKNIAMKIITIIVFVFFISAFSSRAQSQANEGNEPIDAYTRFDFIPGGEILFMDDFSAENIGDFPARWNTNGSGEVVASGDDKMFQLRGSSQYIPEMGSKLPEEFTMEFDLITQGLSRATSSTANFQVLLDDNNKFNKGKNYAWVRIYLTQFTDVGVKVTSNVNGQKLIDNTLKLDLRKKVVNGIHFSIAVNKKRFRMWADENKILDVPTLIPVGIQNIKFALEGFSQDFEAAKVYIDNLRIARGGVDLRAKLLTEGKLSTTAITFNTGSDQLKAESMGIIREIADVLKTNEDIKLKIVGHTDSDGDDTSNLELSRKRALAVKNALVSKYDVTEDRLEVDGKGESAPASPNESPEGKAANRRVEFLKL